MKILGIALVGIGLIVTLITGFNFVTKEKVVDIGKLEITQDKTHNVVWSPLLGVAIMTIGGGFYLFGMKKK